MSCVPSHSPASSPVAMPDWTTTSVTTLNTTVVGLLATRLLFHREILGSLYIRFHQQTARGGLGFGFTVQSVSPSSSCFGGRCHLSAFAPSIIWPGFGKGTPLDWERFLGDLRR